MPFSPLWRLPCSLFHDHVLSTVCSLDSGDAGESHIFPANHFQRGGMDGDIPRDVEESAEFIRKPFIDLGFEVKNFDMRVP